MEEPADPFVRLRGAAAWARQVLLRVASDGGILKQMEAGEWDDHLSAEDAIDAADMLDAVAEHVRSNQALAGVHGSPSSGFQTLASPFRDLTRTHLPLNRKERYYTGTVLPLLIASDGFAHLKCFMRRCGLLDVDVRADRKGQQPFELFTEYGFAESLRSTDARRFSIVPTRETPDVVMIGKDWLLAVEAKMYHHPTASALQAQLRPQRDLIDAWAHDLGIATGRIRHVLLLPQRLAREVQGRASAPVITWEEVLHDYRVVGPAYWVGVLDEALCRYDEMVSTPPSFGANADAHLTGAKIAEMHAAGTLTYNYVGRHGGRNGRRFLEDMAQGKWRTVTYEVREGDLTGSPNWFSIASFLAAPAHG